MSVGMTKEYDISLASMWHISLVLCKITNIFGLEVAYLLEDSPLAFIA
jgi:hypothetical protein